MRHVEGIHHVTAITGDAKANVAFYTGVLGLRMVAKTVNQDDPSVYHLFYGDEEAHPGADLTFFEYPGAIPGHAGAGMVYRVVWRVASPAAIEFWLDRLTAAHVHAERDGESLVFHDREGLQHQLVVDDSQDPPLIARHPEIAPELALHGFEGVRAYSKDPTASEALLEGFLGASRRAEGGHELRGELRGGWIAFDPAPDAPGRQSGGTVHHVAFGIHDADDGEWATALAAARIPNSGIVDRNYFRSLYFREPSGVLYELATQGPGFTVDGPVETLGSRIILPPWLEQHRSLIEPHLTPLPDPRADWPASYASTSSTTDGEASS